ncbi:MAG TPA: ribosome maturation factor RimM [Candidatus Acidoferrum sp.]|nr:ribosome maturation factor RimM [Candidatus Acidoferrum sp.]HEV2488699.1 ribosome maturation factor RimM [Candidatus Acidoferrales bacterium]
MQPARVTLARILRPHGRRGEVGAEILTDFPDRLTKLTSAELAGGKQPPHSVAIRSCWLSKSRGGQAIFHFDGCDSISDAERLVGLEVQVPIEERVALPAGTYYVTDLIGCEIFEKGNAAEKIGVVRNVQFTGGKIPGTPNLVVAAPGGELLIPLAAEICTRIDTAAHRIEVSLPDGLRDLNER